MQRGADRGAVDRQNALIASRAKMGAAALVIAVAVASITYRLLIFGRLQQTAALFVGIPAVIAIVVVYGVSPRSAVGVACKAVTVGLLLSLVLLQEGFLCVAMSAPLFYLVAIGVSYAMTAAKRLPQDKFLRRFMNGAVIVVTVPMSLEGVAPSLSINRNEHIAVTKVVQASATDVERALFQIPRFERTRPRYLRAGFPSIIGTRIEAHGAETRWVVQIRGGEMLLTGMEPKTGELTMSLEERRPGRARWQVLSDTSHTTHFLQWRESMVEWQKVDEGSTRVTWTLRYERCRPAI